jgi:hypothetical protein
LACPDSWQNSLADQDVYLDLVVPHCTHPAQVDGIHPRQDVLDSQRHTLDMTPSLVLHSQNLEELYYNQLDIHHHMELGLIHRSSLDGHQYLPHDCKNLVDTIHDTQDTMA